MKHALNLAEDNRVLSACRVLAIGNYDGMPQVESLPDGNIGDYRYENEEFIYDPLPQPEPSAPEPSQIDMLEAQITYTAMMTDTLLEV